MSCIICSYWSLKLFHCPAFLQDIFYIPMFLTNVFMSAVSVRCLIYMLICMLIPVVMCATVIFLVLDGCIKDTYKDNKTQFCTWMQKPSVTGWMCTGSHINRQCAG